MNRDTANIRQTPPLAAGLDQALAAVSCGAALVADDFVICCRGTADPALAAAHAAEAASRGAAFVVAAPGVALPGDARARLIAVDRPRLALGRLARAAYKTDRAGLTLVGVTGTNGKTTTAFLTEYLLAASGRKVGLLGTVTYRWPGGSRPAALTTPGCLDLHGLFSEMAVSGVDSAVMEVSSHALDQDRGAGLTFAAAAFTNLTQDHLDYHKDMESYFAAKSRLFTAYLESPDRAVVNFDDPFGARLLAGLPGAVGYGLGRAAPAGWRVLSGEVTRHDGSGMTLRASFEGRTWEIASPLIGLYNAHNLLAAMGVGLALGLAPRDMAALSGFGGVPGRLERVRNDRGLDVFVDYAHTPDALENVLRAVREVATGRLVVVFGCGGDRDRTKRPLMARAVAAYAAVAVLPAAHPPHAAPQASMADARPGLAGAARVLQDPDRRRALALALAEMRPGDVLVVAGKGHEAYQQIGDEKFPFHDATVIRELASCA